MVEYIVIHQIVTNGFSTLIVMPFKKDWNSVLIFEISVDLILALEKKVTIPNTINKLPPNKPICGFILSNGNFTKTVSTI